VKAVQLCRPSTVFLCALGWWRRWLPKFYWHAEQNHFSA